MNRDATDPDVGEIELQETFIPDDEWDDQRETIRQTLKDRLWPEGEMFTCPECDEPTFQGRSDLTHRITQAPHVISIRHLHGAHCTSCDATTLEAYDQTQIEDEIGIGFHPDYEAKVSRTTKRKSPASDLARLAPTGQKTSNASSTSNPTRKPTSRSSTKTPSSSASKTQKKPAHNDVPQP